MIVAERLPQGVTFNHYDYVTYELHPFEWYQVLPKMSMATQTSTKIYSEKELHSLLATSVIPQRDIFNLDLVFTYLGYCRLKIKSSLYPYD